jgi:hypothetical protein
MGNNRMTMTQAEKDQAIAIAANELHEAWKLTHFAQKGKGAPRWKALTEDDVAWVNKNRQKGVLMEAIKLNERGQPEQVNIAALSNDQLPPSHAKENTASAQSAIQIILDNRPALDPTDNKDMEALAALVHKAWNERHANDDWAKDLRVSYDALSEPEKAKDRAVIKAAAEAIRNIMGESQQGREEPHRPGY